MKISLQSSIIGIAYLLIIFLFTACNTTANLSDVTNGNGDSFVGVITYDLKFEDKTGEVPKDQAAMFMGDRQIYTIKGNQYKSEMNGMLNLTQYYLGKDTLYSKMDGIEGLLWVDATTNEDEIIDFKIEKNVETVAGINCDLLTINSKEGTTKYYYNEKYGVNSDAFANHTYGFWKFCTEKTKSLPLKSISDLEDIYIEITALEVEKGIVLDSAFDLPDLVRIKNTEQ